MKKKKFLLYFHGFSFLIIMGLLIFFVVKKIKEVPYNPTNPAYIQYLMDQGVEFPTYGFDEASEKEISPEMAALKARFGVLFVYEDGTVIDNRFDPDCTDSMIAHGYGDLFTLKKDDFDKETIGADENDGKPMETE